MREVRIVTPTLCLGYGFSEDEFHQALDHYRPHVIAVDAGSTDPGPYYLGSGKSFTNRLEVKTELEVLMEAALRLRIPLIVGSAGGSGGRPHLAWTRQIVEDLAKEHGWEFTLATIDAEVDREYLKRKLSAGDVIEFESETLLTADLIESSTRIVAQMGPEPIMEALRRGAQIVLAGRACDDAVIAAYPILQGCDPGLSTHLGKILECGALAAEPIGPAVMIGTVRDDCFEVVPASAARACTVTSIVAHSLYERENPVVQHGPGGTIDLSRIEVAGVDSRTVQVRGTLYAPSARYTVKLEGVRPVGFRTISIAGVRDPTMIGQLDEILAEVRRRLARTVARFGPGADKYQLAFHAYGRDAVMKLREPDRDHPAHELGLVADVVAGTQELAHTVCHSAMGVLLHLDFPGQCNNAGNLAFLYSPAEIDMGDVYEFSVYHLMRIADPLELFPIEVVRVDGARGEAYAAAAGRTT
jgi:hypothetical protein